MLLAALAPKLLGALETCTNKKLSRIDVCAAVTAASAKIWIREGVFRATPSVDLKVDRWVDNAGKGVELAKFGLMAPEITKFEIKGASTRRATKWFRPARFGGIFRSIITDSRDTPANDSSQPLATGAILSRRG